MDSVASPEVDAAPGLGGYNPTCFDEVAAVEEEHFWFRARTQVISGLAKQITAELPPGFRVLEVGCGTGNILRALQDACPAGNITGVDYYAEGLRHASGRSSANLLQGDIRALPFRRDFDLVGAFDVLEHLPDDVSVLRCLHALLKPGGALLVTVPAHPSLWSYFDEYSKHCRRYTASELGTKVEEAGFRVEYLTEYMTALLPLVWLGRKAASLKPSGGADSARRRSANDLRVVPVINGALSWLCGQEARFLRARRQMPFGTSLVTIARA
jgi:SAM-dependent methyltransferase